ncbi:TonB-dependent receptor [Novosphingobium album (ex Liu et al. 2023)]|uniref:TonB-dependent receptor n=1 Tax=Novosphingobium album (ex Liu et al. 2023) TaxID=3031130 RepID=A0ABT5WUP2_9SPHN|nr:TonB-dependent receptor [Novosphingobium album (ex Liu et al. 2023)]MDE8653586.1 TonB-dependent receptor [Novosphingobium album (ex Liu et al. 2023)]
MTKSARKLKLGLLCATMLTTSLATAPAYAQAEPAAEADAGDDVIIVSATRRATSIMDTPINISAIGGETLQDERLDDVKDLGAFTPGLTVTDTGPRGSASIVMRGLSADGTGTAGSNYDNAIGTYLGEVPLYLDFKLIDIARVETLLGPQGTLYGLGTLAGAIRYIPERPDPTQVSGSVHGRVYDVAHSSGVGYVGDATVNLPIIRDVLAFRTASGYYYDPGFIDYPFIVAEPGVSIAQPGGVTNPLGTPEQQNANFSPKKDLNWEKTITTRNQLGLTLPTFKAYLTYAFQQTKSGGRQANGYGVLGEGKYEAPWRYAEPSKRQSHLLSLEMEAQLGEIMQAVWTSAYTKTKNHTIGDVTDLLLDLDYDYELFPAFAGFTTGDNTRKQFNQEIRLVSTHGGPFSWVLGGFYNEMKYHADSIERLPGFAEFAASPQGNVIYGNYYNGLVRPDGAEYVSFTDSKTEEMAAFGELTFRPIPAWQITVGGRYFKYDTSITGGSDTPLTKSGRTRMPYPSLEIASSRIRSGKASDDGFVWKLNTSYNFTPDIMAYATYSKGYRIGGVNRVVPCILPINTAEQNLCALPDELSYGPDKVKNMELGVRASLFGGRLNTSLAVFQLNWDGIQLGSSTQYGNIGITANGGKAKSKGVDFTFHAKITDQFTLRGNYSYLDAKLTEDVPGLLSPATGSGDVFSGDRLPGSTKNSGALAAVYTLPVGMNNLVMNWTATYTGGILTSPGARGGGERLPSYVMHRASVTYRTDAWEVSLFANNIFDKYAITGVGQDLTRYRQINDGIIGRYYSRGVATPRVMGLEGRMKF